MKEVEKLLQVAFAPAPTLPKASSILLGTPGSSSSLRAVAWLPHTRRVFVAQLPANLPPPQRRLLPRAPALPLLLLLLLPLRLLPVLLRLLVPVSARAAARLLSFARTPANACCDCSGCDVELGRSGCRSCGFVCSCSGCCCSGCRCCCRRRCWCCRCPWRHHAGSPRVSVRACFTILKTLDFGILTGVVLLWRLQRAASHASRQPFAIAVACYARGES